MSDPAEREPDWDWWKRLNAAMFREPSVPVGPTKEGKQ